MAVKIRLKRMGKIRQPYYRVVVVDARKKRDGRVIEEIGKYHPKEEPSFIEVVSDRAQYWLGVGAQPSDAVAALLKVTGDWQKFKGLPGTEGTLRTKEPKRDKQELFNEALKDAANEPKGDAVTKKKASAKKMAAVRDPRQECRGQGPTSRRRGQAEARRRGQARGACRRGQAGGPAEAKPRRPPLRRPRLPSGDPGRRVAGDHRGRCRRRRRRGREDRRRQDRGLIRMLADALEHLVRGIVEHPDDVVVRDKQLRRGSILEVRVHPSDLGKVIGRGGRTATAFRTVISSLAGRGGARIDFVDVDRKR